MTDLAELMEEQRLEIDRLRRELVDSNRERDRLRTACDMFQHFARGASDSPRISQVVDAMAAALAAVKEA